MYGRKLYKGIMVHLLGAGADARPAMKRLKQFVSADEMDVVSKKGPSGRAEVERHFSRIKADITQWEKRYGAIEISD